MAYRRLHVLRYMGGKGKLLPFIIPELEAITRPGDLILDLMAGTQAVAYALKERNALLVNDVEPYSHCLGVALLENNQFPLMEPLKTEPINGYFTRTYADTYFSFAQCREIDGLRLSIEQFREPHIRFLYLTALIYAMCYAQSTPGHFAQFLPPNHPRVKNLRTLSLTQAFLAKSAELERLLQSKYANKAYCHTWQGVLHHSEAPLDRVRLVYADPPYSAEQYSRFYHLLNTVVLGDEPTVEYKARYRTGRFKSAFCYPGRVREEFRALFQNVATACPRAALAVSYGSRGLMGIVELADLAREVYPQVSVKSHPYTHSTLGKGSDPVTEYLLVAKKG